MTKNRSLALITVVALVALTTVFASASSGQQGAVEDETQAFIRLMKGYLGVGDQWVSMASTSESAVYLALEGITEIYEQRGERAKAIEHLNRLLDESGDNRAVRTIISFKLRDLYNETGRGDQALAVLDRIVADNR